jgi:hypothetical protein
MMRTGRGLAPCPEGICISAKRAKRRSVTHRLRSSRVRTGADQGMVRRVWTGDIRAGLQLLLALSF